MLCSKLTEASLKTLEFGKTYFNSSVPQQPPIDIELLLRDCVKMIKRSMYLEYFN